MASLPTHCPLRIMFVQTTILFITSVVLRPCEKLSQWENTTAKVVVQCYAISIH